MLIILPFQELEVGGVAHYVQTVRGVGYAFDNKDNA